MRTKLIYEKYIHYQFDSYGWRFKGNGPIPEAAALVKDEAVIASTTAWLEEINNSHGEYFFK
jgi:hypothetical protein